MSDSNQKIGSSDGDESSLRCPVCEHDHCFQDWIFEGWNGSANYSCDGCGQSLDIEVECSAEWFLTARVNQK